MEKKHISNTGKWSLLKQIKDHVDPKARIITERGIYGVCRVVSKKYLQAYIDEYSWRYNNRIFKDKMFEKLLNEIVNVKVVPARIV